MSSLAESIVDSVLASVRTQSGSVADKLQKKRRALLSLVDKMIEAQAQVQPKPAAVVPVRPVVPQPASPRAADSGQVLRVLAELSGGAEVPVPLSALRPRFAALDPVLSMLAAEGAILPLVREGYTQHPEAYWKNGTQIIDRVVPTTYGLDIARSLRLRPGEPRPVYHRDVLPDQPGADLIAALLSVPTIAEEAGRMPLGTDRAHRPAELADDVGTEVFSKLITSWHEGSLAAYLDAAAWLRALGVRARPVAWLMEKEAAALELRHLRLPAHQRETYARRLGNIGPDRGDLYTLLTGVRELSGRFTESQHKVEQWILGEMGDQPVYQDALNMRLSKSPHGSASATEAIDALIARGEVASLPAPKGGQAGLVRIRSGAALPAAAKPKRGPVQRATIYHLGLVGQVVREEGRDYDAAEQTWQNATARGRRKGYRPTGEPWLLVLGGWDHPTFKDARGQDPEVASFDAEMVLYLESHPEVRVLADFRPSSPAAARIEAPPVPVSVEDRALFKSVLDRHWQAMGKRTPAPGGVAVRGDEVGVLLQRVYVGLTKRGLFDRFKSWLLSQPLSDLAQVYIREWEPDPKLRQAAAAAPTQAADAAAMQAAAPTQAAEAAAPTRLYHLDIRKMRIHPGGRTEDTDDYERLTGYPVTHDQARKLKSNFKPDQQARILFVDASAPVQPALVTTDRDLAEQEERAAILGREHAETRRRPLNRDRSELTKLFMELAWDGDVSEERLLHLQLVYSQAFKLARVAQDPLQNAAPAAAPPPALPAAPPPGSTLPPAGPDEPDEEPALPPLRPAILDVNCRGSKPLPDGRRSYEFTGYQALLERDGWTVLPGRGHLHCVPPPSMTKVPRWWVPFSVQAPSEQDFRAWAQALHAYFQAHPDRLTDRPPLWDQGAPYWIGDGPVVRRDVGTQHWSYVGRCAFQAGAVPINAILHWHTDEGAAASMNLSADGSDGYYRWGGTSTLLRAPTDPAPASPKAAQEREAAYEAVRRARRAAQQPSPPASSPRPPTPAAAVTPPRQTAPTLPEDEDELDEMEMGLQMAVGIENEELPGRRGKDRTDALQRIEAQQARLVAVRAALERLRSTTAQTSAPASPQPTKLVWSPYQRHQLIDQIEALANEPRLQPTDHSVYRGPDGTVLVTFAGHERSCAVRLSSGEIYGPFMGCTKGVEIALEYIADALGIDDKWKAVEPLRTGALGRARAGQTGPAYLFAPAVPSEVQDAERILSGYRRTTAAPGSAEREALELEAEQSDTKSRTRQQWLADKKKTRDGHREGTRIWKVSDKNLQDAKDEDAKESRKEEPLLMKRRHARWEDLLLDPEADLATRLGAYVKLRPGSRHFDLARAAARRVALSQGVPAASADFIAGQAALYVFEHPGLETLYSRVRLEMRRLQDQAGKDQARAAVKALELPHHREAAFEERLAGTPPDQLAALVVEARGEAKKYVPVVDPAAVPAAPPLEAYTTPAPALRWPALNTSPPTSETGYVPSSTTDEWLRGFYQAHQADHGGVWPSTRVVPLDMTSYPFAIGAWRMDPHLLLYGRLIEQLRVLTPQMLAEVRVSEATEDHKEPDVVRYAGWLREGMVPPPIVLVTQDDGVLKVIEGHRRRLAAIAADKPLLAWVGDAVRTGINPGGGVMWTGLTFELANPEPVLSAVRGRDRGDIAESMAFGRADAVLRVRRGWSEAGDLAYLATLSPAAFRAAWVARKKALQVGLQIAPVPGVFPGPLEALQRLENSMKGRPSEDQLNRPVTFRYTDLNGNELDITGVSGDEVLEVHLVTAGESTDGPVDTEAEAVAALHKHEWPEVLLALDRALDLDSESD